MKREYNMKTVKPMSIKTITQKENDQLLHTMFSHVKNVEFTGDEVTISSPETKESLLSVHVLGFEESTKSMVLNYKVFDPGSIGVVDAFLKLQNEYHRYMSQNTPKFTENIPYISLQLFEFKHKEGIPSGSSKITAEQFRLYKEFGQFWEFTAIVLKPGKSILGKATKLALKLMANNMKSVDPTARVKLFTNRDEALSWMEKETGNLRSKSY